MELNEDQRDQIVRKLEIYRLRSDVFIEEERNISVFLISNDSEENLKQLNKILGMKFKRILFDNMSPKQLKKCLKICKNKYETENSGNATLKNIKKISNTGINRISVGALTHSAKSFDVSLELSS